MLGQKCREHFLGNGSPERTKLPSKSKVGLESRPTQRLPSEPELTCLRGGVGQGLAAGAGFQGTVGRAQRQDKATLCP